MCVAQTRILFLSLSGHGRDDLNISGKVYPQYCKEWTTSYAWEGVPNNAIFISKLAIFLFTYLGLAWLGTLLIFIILLFLFFLESHLLHKASNHLIINTPFYLQHPLYISSLIPGMLNVYYSCWRVGLQPLLLLLLNLLGGQQTF